MKPFFDTLRDLRQGAALDELADELAAVVRAVRECNKAGELTLKLRVAPASNGDISTLIVTDSITAKPPRLSKGGTVFFSDDHNNLSRRDPRQAEIELRSVTAPVQPIRTVEAQ